MGVCKYSPFFPDRVVFVLLLGFSFPVYFAIYLIVGSGNDYLAKCILLSVVRAFDLFQIASML
jgi:hypothetical protein